MGVQSRRVLRVLTVLALAASCAVPDDLPVATILAQPPAAQQGYPSVMAAFAAARQAEARQEPAYRIAGDTVLRAVNRHHQFEATFADDGVTVFAGGGRVRSRLTTVGLGCDGAMEPVRGPSPQASSESPNRVLYRRTAGAAAFDEWYENGPQGLEQGFDVARPACSGDLVIDVAVDGLEPVNAGRARDGGPRVHLRDASGVAQLVVSGLAARDADGRVLPATMTASGGRLTMRVDTAGASWPVVVDPYVTTQVVELGPDIPGGEGAYGDNFGNAVSLSGDTAVVGVSHDDVGPAVDQGAAYVYVRSEGAWFLQGKLIASDGAGGDAFGCSVSVSGDTVVVGARLASGPGMPHQGAAYVFVRAGTTWVQQAKLLANAVDYRWAVGAAVAISGDTVVVGAPQYTIALTTNRGAAFVFVRSGTTWTQQAMLTISGGATGDQFGGAVSLSFDTLLVGASFAKVGSSAGQGAAWVFVRAGATWTQQAKLTSVDGDASDGFGTAVSVSGETAVVGAASAGVGTSAGVGAAYAYVRSGATWTLQAPLIPSDLSGIADYGVAVSVSGDTAVVGADKATAGGIPALGAASVFVRTGDVWSQQATLSSGDGVGGTGFGSAVSVSGNSLLVGAPLATSGTNKGQGATLTFVRDGTAWSGDATLTTGTGAQGANFGYSISASGDTLAIGAPGNDGATVPGQGAVYVFTRNGSDWTRLARLSPSDGTTMDFFGFSAALSGDTLVVGAPWANIDGRVLQGAAYVFVRNGASWTQQAKLVASDGAASHDFGWGVALSGDTAMVGSPGVTEGPSASQGAAYVFVRNGTTWTQEGKLAAGDGAVGDAFGQAVTLSGDTGIVGAPYAKVGANTFQGAAYVFLRSGSVWSQQAALTASDGAKSNYFGSSVSLSGDSVVVGAEGATVGTVKGAGAAYVFVGTQASWVQQARLVASDPATSSHLGTAVSIDANIAIVGAYFSDVGASLHQGTGFAFIRNGTAWTEQAKLTSADGAENDDFGDSVAVSGHTAFFGAWHHGGPAPYGNSQEGRAYVFELENRGAPCADAAGCMSTYCVDGVCCDTPCVGGVDGPCRACSVATGATADGTCSPLTGPSCDDGSVCTQVDTCQAGVCVGANAVSCDDGNTCTDDSCDAATGCGFTNNAAPCATAKCEGGKFFAAATCSAGSCPAQVGASCDDGDACTADACDAQAGCTHSPIAGCCNGDADCPAPGPCLTHGCDLAAHVCTAAARIPGCCTSTADCNDGNACTTDLCDGTTQCVHAYNTLRCAAAGCDAGGFYAAAYCSNGSCPARVATPCDDGNACTDDACDPALGCVHGNNAVPCAAARCDGGSFYAAASCSGGACPIQVGVGCDDLNACTADACDPALGCVHANNAAPCAAARCDGGSFHAAASCSGGACPIQAGVGCDDGNACTADGCDAGTGCLHVGIPGCCNVDATCLPPGKCLARPCDTTAHACGKVGAIADCCATQEDCDDGDAGTVDSCDASTGLCSNVPPCTSATDCDDQDDCTADTCQADTGRCVHEAIGGCCRTDADCGDGGTCIGNACTNGAEVGPESSTEVADEAIAEQSTATELAEVPGEPGPELEPEPLPEPAADSLPEPLADSLAEPDASPEAVSEPAAEPMAEAVPESFPEHLPETLSEPADDLAQGDPTAESSPELSQDALADGSADAEFVAPGVSPGCGCSAVGAESARGVLGAVLLLAGVLWALRRRVVTG